MWVVRAAVVLGLVLPGCTRDRLEATLDLAAPVAVAQPPGGAFRELPANVVIGTDEPAIVFYTLDGTDPTKDSPSAEAPVTIGPIGDGTEIRFVARDLVGNRAAPLSETYRLDLAGPGPVTRLSIATSSTAADVSWTPPSDPDFAGVVLARIVDAPIALPVDGTFYEAGASLSPTTQVVSAGAAASFMDGGRSPGPVRYAAWAYDAVGNYGPIRVVAGDVPLPEQLATITVDVASESVTIDPADLPFLHLSGTAAHSGTALSLVLTLENRASRIVFNPKVVLRSVAGGSYANPSPGTVDGDLYRFFGTRGLAPGSSATRTLDFAPVAPNATVTLGVEARGDPGLIWAGWDSTAIADLGARRQADSLPNDPAADGPNGGYRRYGGTVSWDGSFLDVGSGQAPHVTRIDLTSLAVVGGVALTTTNGGRAHVYGTELDPTGAWLYALLVDGSHHPQWGDVTDNADQIGVSLVRLDAVTLAETARVGLSVPEGRRVRARRFAVSPDGRLAAVPVVDFGMPKTGAIHFVELGTMTEIDTDATTPGIQPVETTGIALPTAVAFSSDGARLFAGSSFAAAVDASSPTDPVHNVAVVDLASFELSAFSLGGTNDAARAVSLAAAPDGRLVVGTLGAGLFVYDPARGELTTLPDAGGTANAVRFSPDGRRLYVSSFGTTTILEYPQGNSLGTFDSTLDELIGNWLVRTPF